MWRLTADFCKSLLSFTHKEWDYPLITWNYSFVTSDGCHFMGCPWNCLFNDLSGKTFSLSSFRQEETLSHFYWLVWFACLQSMYSVLSQQMRQRIWDASHTKVLI